MDNSHSVTTDVLEGIPVLVVQGDMTSDADSDVLKNYNDLKSKYSPEYIIINFEKTNYINSAGIATLINMIQDLGKTNGRLVLVGLSSHFQKVMDIVGISDFVDIFNTSSEALGKIKN